MRIDAIYKTIKYSMDKGILLPKKEMVYVPTDLVYYGHQSTKNRIYIGNSSRVAAHFEYKRARENALAELIERDAIMRNWFLHESPLKLSPDLFPLHVKRRAEYRMKQGRILYVLDLPSRYDNVILVAIVSGNYPGFVCGAAATFQNIERDFDDIVNKALQEAEYCLYTCLTWPDYTEIKAEEVKTPKDHGKFYHNPSNAKTLDWLWSGQMCKTLLPYNSFEFTDIARMLEIIEVRLSNDNAPINVIRLLSPKLVPISFGLYNIHYRHREIGGKCDNRCFLFPHRKYP